MSLLDSFLELASIGWNRYVRPGNYGVQVKVMVGKLQEVFDHLLKTLGPQHWWPGESSLEVLVGAVLTQNTSWKNVERAIENLRQADLLSLPALLELHDVELAELIRPAGYYQQKARRLKNLLQFIQQRYGGSLDDMFQTPLSVLREELLALNGIGPETADAILLYAGELPTFVVDTYTARIGHRHGWLPEDADYDLIQEEFQRQLPTDAAVYNEYHALLVNIGKNYCHKTRPDCEQCPLRPYLPEYGWEN